MLAGMLQQPGGAELAHEYLQCSGASSDALHALHAAQSLSQSGVLPVLCDLAFTHSPQQLSGAAFSELS